MRAGMDAEDDLCDEFVRRAVAMRCAWCETDRKKKREKKLSSLPLSSQQLMAVQRASAGTSTREVSCPARARCLLPLRRSRRRTTLMTHGGPGRARQVGAAKKERLGGREEYDFTYDGNDGRKKATFEQAFKGGVTEDLQDRLHAAPWEFSCVPRLLDRSHRAP